MQPVTFKNSFDKYSERYIKNNSGVSHLKVLEILADWYDSVIYPSLPDFPKNAGELKEVLLSRLSDIPNMDLDIQYIKDMDTDNLNEDTARDLWILWSFVQDSYLS